MNGGISLTFLILFKHTFLFTVQMEGYLDLKMERLYNTKIKSLYVLND